MKMKTITAIEGIKRIEKEAKQNEINSKLRKRVRVVTNMKENQVIRQGDIYIVNVDEDHKVGEKVTNRQLVDGVSVGSRHVLVGDDIEVYEGVALPYFYINDYPISYAFRLNKGAAVITHPEHDHIRIECPGLYQVTQQMDSRTRRAVQD